MHRDEPGFIRPRPHHVDLPHLAPHGVAARFATLLAATDSLTEPLRNFVTDAKTAYAGLSRQGFRDHDMADPAVAGGFAAGEAPLFALRTRLSAFGQVLARAGGDDAASWSCATSLWASDHAKSRADSIYAAFGQLPTVAGITYT